MRDGEQEIGPDQFEAYEAVSRSGQMPDHEVPKFLDDNPEFKAWYLERNRPA
jgi:hypothetical protein